MTKDIISNANTKHSVVQLVKYTDIPIRTFKNAQEAGRWVVTAGLSKAKPGTCASRIYSICDSDKCFEHVGYGYSWKFSGRSID